MPAINYYIRDQTYARLVYLSAEKGVKLKELIDIAVEEYLVREGEGDTE